jgi:hypothetical protein
LMMIDLRALLLCTLPATLLAACGGGIAPLNSIAVANQRPAMKSQTFQYVGESIQTFQVPAKVTNITITAEGAGTPSARGGFAKATIGVHPGAMLAIVVGGAPHGYKGGYNGGGAGGVCGIDGPCPLRAEGGAGASDVRIDGSAQKDRVLVAGGAGGNGGAGQYNGGFGGVGGGVVGSLGDNGVGVDTASYGLVGGGGGGGGGSRFAGGKHGAPGKAGSQNIIPGNPGTAGALVDGGTGGPSAGADLAGGSGGGGGGGYYGGGGGGSGANGSKDDRFGKGVGSGGGGGGGSSFIVSRAKNIDIETGNGSDKNGLVIISW